MPPPAIPPAYRNNLYTLKAKPARGIPRLNRGEIISSNKVFRGLQVLFDMIQNVGGVSAVDYPMVGRKR